MEMRARAHRDEASMTVHIVSTGCGNYRMKERRLRLKMDLISGVI
jgi:hypothetical protein